MLVGLLHNTIKLLYILVRFVTQFQSDLVSLTRVSTRDSCSFCDVESGSFDISSDTYCQPVKYSAMSNNSKSKQKPKKTNSKGGNTKNKKGANSVRNKPTGNNNIPARSSGSRCYCWTLNNPTEEDVFKIVNTFQDPQYCIRFICWGEEIGEGTPGVPDGTPHLQGYMELTKQGISQFILSWHIRSTVSPLG